MKFPRWTDLALLVLLVVSQTNAAKIVQQFTDPRMITQFRHLVLHDVTGHVYVGSKNRVYDLNADLESIHSPVETGPKDDHLNCQPRPGGHCYCMSPANCGKVPTDSYNQALALNIAGDILYACSNLYYGSCSIIELSSFTEQLQSYKPIMSNDISMEDSSVVALVAPGIDEENGNLYIASTRSSIGYAQFTDSVPLIASRRLSDFELAHFETGTSSSVQPLHRYKDTFKVYYKFGFSYSGFTYFLALQKSDSGDPLDANIPYVSRIIRVCQGDPKFYSYVEIPMRCEVDGINEDTFNLVQSAYIARPGRIIAQEFNLRNEEEALFVLFSSSEDFSYVPRSPSAVCVYMLKNIADIFKQNQKYCFDGYGQTGPKHITSPKRCITTSFEEFECGQHSANHPIQGKFGNVVQSVSARIGNIVGTSIVAKAVGDFTVVYVGDNRGHLVKMLLHHVSGVTRGAMFSNTSIDSDHKAILKDVALDEAKEHIYMMSESKVYKVQLSDCAQYSTCNMCRGSGDPVCGWCASIDRCTTVDECADAEYVWIDITQKCPNILSMQPSHLPYTDANSATVRLRMMELPGVDDDKMRCHIKTDNSPVYRSRVFSNTFDRTLTCQGFDGLPEVNNDLGHVNASLLVVLDNRQWLKQNIAIYDCTKSRGCDRCTKGPFPCGWCVMDGECVDEGSSCATQGPIIISEAVDVVSSPAIITGSGQSTAFTECPYIEPINPPYIVHSGNEIQIEVGSKNVKLWKGINDVYHTLPMRCVFEMATEIVRVDAVVAEDRNQDEALVTCGSTEFSYVEDIGMVDYPVDVEWEFGPALENPNNIQVSVYKCQAMVSNCGACLSLDPSYQCGWCQSVCTLEEGCPNWLDQGSVCANPNILRFEPSAGPVNGGTSVTVHGINLGREPDDLIGHVKVADIPCDVQVEGYVPSTMFICVTRAAGQAKSGPVSVSVIGKYDHITQSVYDYTEPIFHSLMPNKGLITGKTLVSLYGENLGLGSEATVYVNDRKCDIKWRNDTNLQFETPKVAQPMVARVRLEIDATDYDLDLTFNYVPNPEILNINPLHAIVSGGNLINVTGTNIDGVQRARVTILESLENLAVDCSIVDASTFTCMTPSATDLNLNIPETGLPLNYEFYLDELIITQEKLHQTMEGGYKPLTLWGDPIIEALTGVLNYEAGEIYVLTGTNVQVLRKFPDWKVLVGGTVCPGFCIGNNDDTVEFQAPDEPEQLSSKGLAAIEVSLGHYSDHPGDIQYAVPSEDKLPLILGLVFGLVVPIILAILLIVVCLKRQSLKNSHKKRRALLTDNRGNYHPASMLPPPTEMHAADVPTANDEEQGLITESPASPDEGDTENATPKPDYVERLLNKILDKKLRKEVSEIIISRERLNIGDVIGNGHFGCVYSASLKNENLTNASKVAVKTLQGDDFPPNMVSAFLEEGVVMKKFDHPHVLRLLGVGVGDNEEPMVIIPFMAQGDLRTYVRNKEKSFTARQLLQLAQQVAKGMAYLASLNFVHRDLAARNCMIDEENVVKVADFGLSKNLFEKDYYSSTRDRKTKLPVKWMALESLEEFRFTIKSDIWSFGVLMWELMTRGTTPYPDVDIFDLRTFLQEGRRLPKPKYCPDHVYTIMTDCWNKYPEYRPTFADLVNRLELLLNPPKKRESAAPSSEPMYVNFNEFDSAEYLNPISAPQPDTPGSTVETPSPTPPLPSGPPTTPPPEPPRKPETPTSPKPKDSIA